MHRLAVIAIDRFVPSDLAIPCDLFGRTCLDDGRAAYDVVVCGETRRVGSAAFDLLPPAGLDRLADVDTIVVPGFIEPSTPVSRNVVLALQDAAARGCRIASICTGAFVLAAAGLLDGLRATTHWLAAPELARRYPRISVDANVLFIDNGDILTSAGASAALDLCLHMVRRDHGVAIAAEAARKAVAPLIREGGQAQYALHPAATGGPLMQPILDWMAQRWQQPLTLEALAAHAAMSTRTFSRRFHDCTGTTPMQWLFHKRVREAQRFLETTSWPIERVAEAAGFGSAAAFRAKFVSVVGTSPQRYRQLFRIG